VEPAGWLVGVRSWVELRQRSVADYLSRKTQYWNRGSWVIALIIFAVLFGGGCLWLLLHAIIHF
jgi:hypothetical protein